MRERAMVRKQDELGFKGTCEKKSLKGNGAGERGKRVIPKSQMKTSVIFRG